MQNCGLRCRSFLLSPHLFGMAMRRAIPLARGILSAVELGLTHAMISRTETLSHPSPYPCLLVAERCLLGSALGHPVSQEKGTQREEQLAAYLRKAAMQ